MPAATIPLTEEEVPENFTLVDGGKKALVYCVDCGRCKEYKPSVARYALQHGGVLQRCPPCHVEGLRMGVVDNNPTTGGKGGCVDRNGYIIVRRGRQGQCLEHRLVAEYALGRLLRPNEVIHHINGIRADNRPENLELWETRGPKGRRASDPHCPTCICTESGVS